jgi:hypothetical protein
MSSTSARSISIIACTAVDARTFGVHGGWKRRYSIGAPRRSSGGSLSCAEVAGAGVDGPSPGCGLCTWPSPPSSGSSAAEVAEGDGEREAGGISADDTGLEFSSMKLLGRSEVEVDMGGLSWDYGGMWAAAVEGRGRLGAMARWRSWWWQMEKNKRPLTPPAEAPEAAAGGSHVFPASIKLSLK